MDGDRAPLIQLSELAEETGAHVIVDEAHATGVYGPKGAGCVAENNLCERVLARVHTFGKALGYRGACVIGSLALREHLINRSRLFMYTTAPDLLAIRCIREAYTILVDADSERQQLHSLIKDVNKLKQCYPELSFLPSESPIQGVLTPGNAAALAAERALCGAGFAVRAIRAPTVPSGLERVRLCLHSFNQPGELRAAFDVLRQSIPQTPKRVGGLDG